MSRATESPAIKARLGAAAQACARRGARLTELRRDVLALVLQAEGPATAYQLLDRLRGTRPRAVPPTIYRALDFLVSAGLIHKIERLSAFISCTDSRHPHAAQFLICRRCGSVAEIDDRAVARALEHAAAREGFHPGHVVVELDGTCAACSERP